MNLGSTCLGVGKTQTIIHFLRALLASPEHEHVGVIIFLFTKQQIDEVVSQAQLATRDYAVLMTAENEGERELINSGAPDPSTARVVFTTQQRLQLRTRTSATLRSIVFVAVLGKSASGTRLCLPPQRWW